MGTYAVGHVSCMTKDEPIDLTGVVVLRRDLLAAGYTDRQIRTMVKTRELHRIRHGSYCHATTWDSLSAADRHRVLARAVLARAHPSTVLTHVSAAIEHGVPVWGHDLTKVHTTRSDGRAGRARSATASSTRAACRATTSRRSTECRCHCPLAARSR